MSFSINTYLLEKKGGKGMIRWISLYQKPPIHMNWWQISEFAMLAVIRTIRYGS